MHQHVGRLGRSTLREHINKREHLESAEHAGQQYETGDWPQQREGDAPERAPSPGTVHACRIEIRAGNPLQAGQMLVFLTGLQRIPRAYLDAACVDGAGAWRAFWRVTFPLLRPVTGFVLLTGVLGAFQMFTLVYVLTQGGPAESTDVLVHRIYQTGFVSQAFAMASALALLLSIVLLAFRWPQLRVLRKETARA